MPTNVIQSLHRLARLLGVQLHYVDMAQRRRRASPETLVAVIRALGVGVDRLRDVPEHLERLRLGRAQCRLEPVQVIWGGGRRRLELQLPASEIGRRWRVTWRSEDGGGEVRDYQGLAAAGDRGWRVKGTRWCRVQVPVPGRLPVGYHEVEIESGDQALRGRVIVAPRHVFEPEDPARIWGLFAPLYAVRSERSWGVGTYSDLARLVRWMAERGGRLMGTLPLLPAFLDEPREPSPYSPVTRLGWNELFLDLEVIPELALCARARALVDSAEFRRDLEVWRQGPLVSHREVMRAKRRVLEILSEFLFSRPSDRRDACEEFLKAKPEMALYARFRAVAEGQGRSWTEWPDRMRSGELRPTDGLLRVERLHGYAQWLAHEQISQVAERARRQGVGLYLDLPLGTHRDGYDAWRYQELFALGASGGAPPDPVFTRGQDWGFAPMHPERSRMDGHRYLIAYLRHHLAQADILRLDHVMGLHRLYWVPRGLEASDGAYVEYPAEELYAVLCVESLRHRAVFVGEDLGTVPPEVQRRLRRHRVCGMYVCQYEFRASPRSPLRAVPVRTMGSVNTHDMPPFLAWCRGLDLEDGRDLGLWTAGQVRRERGRRGVILGVLRKKLAKGEWVMEDAKQVGLLLDGLLEDLARSKARYMLVNLEDLWLETRPQNVPGTSVERDNWCRKLRLSLEELRVDSAISRRLGRLDRLRRGDLRMNHRKKKT